MTSQAYRDNFKLIEWKPIRSGRVVGVVRPDRPAFHIIKDIEPYQSVITGEVIAGRRQHREHMKAHDVVEAGNEKPRPHKRVEMPDARNDVKTALEMVRGGYRPDHRTLSETNRSQDG